jgi:hypothetical protein
MVTHTCNPSYSGDREQEDQGSKPAPANSSRDPISKKPITKKGWWSDSRCRPWVQTPVPQKKKRTISFGSPQHFILPISASQIARITGMRHWHLAFFFFKQKAILLACISCTGVHSYISICLQCTLIRFSPTVFFFFVLSWKLGPLNSKHAL